jgi:hypothetical protein
MPTPATAESQEYAARGSVIELEVPGQRSTPRGLPLLPGATSARAFVLPGMTAMYDVGGIAPGTYFFHCDIHPFMHGTFIVTP